LSAIAYDNFASSSNHFSLTDVLGQTFNERRSFAAVSGV
jgi:hypothetical protein